jgi:putative ABC transport system substrate-binding protein
MFVTDTLKGDSMNRRFWLCSFFASLLGAPVVALAQRSGRVYRVGVLGVLPADPSDADAVRLGEVFLQALRERGYVEGDNLVIERRFWGGVVDRLPKLAAELASLNLDVVTVNTNPAAKAMKEATSSTPIVMLLVSDPVGAGLVPSLSRPGGNLTGVTDIQEDLTLKRIELLKMAMPKAARVSVLTSDIGGFDPVRLAAIRKGQSESALGMGVSLSRFDIRTAADFAGVAAAIEREHPDALFLDHRPINFYLRKSIAQFAIDHRLPTMASQREQATAGILMSFGTSTAWQAREAADYVDKILKGAAPADLPIQQPTQFELVINMRTAKVLGLTVPQSLLLRADEVIE